ncbi:MAG: endonuclease/exonuclease/phosphatase family protein [Planctomycetota bacterium]
MRRGALICIGAILLTGCAARKGAVTARAGEPDRLLRVLTLNLMQHSPIAGRGERFEKIADFLEARAKAGEPVDVVALQEGCSGLVVGTADSIADLGRQLERRGLRYHRHSAPQSGTPLFLLFRVGVLTSGPILYTDGRDLGGLTGNRMDDFPVPGRQHVVLAGMDYPIGRVNLLSAHLSSGGGADLHTRQARELLAFIEEMNGRHPADVTVLGGDMNTSPDTEAYRVLAGELTDSYAAAKSDSPGYTWDVPGNPHRLGHQGDPARIDFIFFRGEGVEVERSEVVFDKDDGWVSDHCGVLTTLRRTGRR